MVVYIRKCLAVLAICLLLTQVCFGHALLSRELLGAMEEAQYTDYFQIGNAQVPSWEELRLYPGVQLHLEAIGTGHGCQLTDQYRFSIAGVLTKSEQVQVILNVTSSPDSSCGSGALFIFEGDFEESFIRVRRQSLQRLVESFVDRRSGIRLFVHPFVPTVGDLFVEVLNLPGQHKSALPFLSRCRIPHQSKLFIEGKLEVNASHYVVKVMDSGNGAKNGDRYPICPKHTLALVGEQLLNEHASVFKRAAKLAHLTSAHMTKALNEAKLMSTSRWVMKVNKATYGQPCVLNSQAKTWRVAYEAFMVVSNGSEDPTACQPSDLVIGLSPDR